MTGPAKLELGKRSGRLGMTQLSILSRVVERFTSQDVLIQAAVLGR